ncbi:hypothetical protein AAU61_15580 [Desulfocarbo indianensis]|nr:hypothetical protein AAU61_15580 [Desulfocarbo indianensis]
METEKVDELEMRLLRPAAAVPKRTNRTKEPDHAAGPIHLELGRHKLAIRPHGRLDVEALLSGLPPALRAARECHELRVDLSQVSDFDDLALSALIVLLRNYGQGFGNITLKGLPVWSSARLRDTGAENLLGRDWRGVMDMDEARFKRCSA